MKWIVILPLVVCAAGLGCQKAEEPPAASNSAAAQADTKRAEPTSSKTVMVDSAKDVKVTLTNPETPAFQVSGRGLRGAQTMTPNELSDFLIQEAVKARAAGERFRAVLQADPPMAYKGVLAFYQACEPASLEDMAINGRPVHPLAADDPATIPGAVLIYLDQKADGVHVDIGGRPVGKPNDFAAIYDALRARPTSGAHAGDPVILVPSEDCQYQWVLAAHDQATRAGFSNIQMMDPRSPYAHQP